MNTITEERPEAMTQALELTATRTFDAPVALVFAAWTAPEHLRRWWGPKDFVCEAFEMDFRPGGAWRSLIRSESGEPFGASGRYLEIIENSLLRFTFAWAAPDAVETEVTVRFTESHGRTTVAFHQTPFESEASRDSHLEGWEEALERLGSFVAGQRPVQ